MRIGCLQFAPQVGDVDNNLNRADAVLSKANPKNLDLLVLPELAFSGYNFKSLQHISPFLEPTTSGITSLWARTTALKYECTVIVGYPEKVDVAPKWPASPEYYNSAITVNSDGETIANYRKSFLYYTDEPWALEGPDGFYDGEIDGLGNVAMGICMDLNPYKFEAPWSAWEFAYHVLHKQANLVILSMAWLTREDARSYSRLPKEPDMDTLSYWLARLEPLIRAETVGEIICVFANRTGTEDEYVYAGTSAVLGIHAGEVKVYGILGRGEKELLVVDTDKRPQAKLISEPSSTASDTPASPKIKSSKDSKDSTGTKNSAVVEAIKETKEERQARKLKEALKREDSSTSEKSSISTDSATAGITIPDSLEPPRTIDEIITPLSPVSPNSSSAFFALKGRRNDADGNLREALMSSVSQGKQQQQQQFTPPQPSSPTFARPASPKSRNASRTRNIEIQQPALLTHDLMREEQITRRRERVKEPQILLPMVSHSAAASPEMHQSIFSEQIFGPRSAHTSPRPKSTVW